MVLWTYLLLYLTYGIEIDFPKCSVYQCGQLADNECARMNETHFVLKSCSKGTVCDFQISPKPSTCKALLHSRFPGEYCTAGTECITNNCDKNICVGDKEGSTCHYNHECNPRLFCDGERGKCCSVAHENEYCESRKLCDSGLLCYDSKCIRIGSIKVGDSTDTPEACETLHMHEGICTKGPKLVRDHSESQEGPINCKDKCTYIYEDNYKFTTRCTCTKQSNPSLLCNPGNADINIGDYLYYIRNLDMNNHNRHIGCGVLCLTKDFDNMELQYYKAFIAYTNLTQWASAVTDLECVKQIFHDNYWRALGKVKELDETQDKKVLYLFLIITFSVILIGMIVLFIIYLKRHSCQRKYDEAKDDDSD
eukprot:TRINITY_DN213_c0_g2_i1.p1 TRINITY_DN213_c0_g2~~TRINITY_DN213_c0_g2_i1.p1  ORF type:complete len:377 (-),score=52.44 TRINITY_DN213_c0_g2_i1:57-1151(-)